MMATDGSEDEYDRLIEAIGDEEWDALMHSQPTQFAEPSSSLEAQVSEDVVDIPAETDFVQGSSTSSNIRREDTPNSTYFPDDDDELDDAVLRQLDEIERILLDASQGTAPLPPNTEHQPLPTNKIPSPDLTPGSMKRRRDSSEDLCSSRKKGKVRDEVEWTTTLDEYEEEITCPICFDVLVGAHLINGCGHTLCGPCGHSWIVEKYHNTCPICRKKCHALTPLIPNITADNFVQKHIHVRAKLGDKGWKAGGSKLLEWQARKDKWKEECSYRSKKQPAVRVLRPQGMDNLVELVYAANGIFH